MKELERALFGDDIENIEPEFKQTIAERVKTKKTKDQVLKY